MYIFMKHPMKHSNAKEGVGGDTSYLDGKTQSLAGLETFT